MNAGGDGAAGPEDVRLQQRAAGGEHPPGEGAGEEEGSDGEELEGDDDCAIPPLQLVRVPRSPRRRPRRLGYAEHLFFAWKKRRPAPCAWPSLRSVVSH